MQKKNQLVILELKNTIPEMKALYICMLYRKLEGEDESY